MTAHEITLADNHGRALSARFQRPPGAPSACAILFHTLPGDDNAAQAALAGSCLAQGWCVLSINVGATHALDSLSAFDPADATACVAEAESRFGLPILLIGHGYGGLLAIDCAGAFRLVRGLALINTPAGVEGYNRRASKGGGNFSLGTVSLSVPEAALESLSWPRLETKVERLRRALMVLHAPMDNVAEINNAARIFTAAKHPKNFIALDGSDHLLSRTNEAKYAASLIAVWAGRYLAQPPGEGPHLTEATVAEAGGGPFRQFVAAGRHRLLADEPVSVGGDDTGPSPYELLLAALGACTAMTLRMYAQHKQIPLTRVEVSLRHEKIHASACQECETKEGKIDRIERVVTLEGDLDQDTRQRLLEIANKCPVHRTLHSEVWVPTRLAD